MKILPAIAVGIVILLVATDIEAGVIVGGGLLLLAAALLVSEKLIGKRKS